MRALSYTTGTVTRTGQECEDAALVHSVGVPVIELEPVQNSTDL